MPRSSAKTFYHYLYGDWDSLRRWAWLYVHVGVLLAAALAGYALARGRYLLALLCLPLTLGFLYRRYTYARPAGARS
jgi:hypothetical protein